MFSLLAAAVLIAPGPLEVIEEQARAWNAGDLDGFMKHYWNDERLSFSSGGRTLRGWQTTLDNYRRRYPTKAAMGKVSFSELELEPLGDDAAFVLGRWRVEPAEGPAKGGNFTLVFRRIDGRWVIVHDHTSASEPNAP